MDPSLLSETYRHKRKSKQQEIAEIRAEARSRLKFKTKEGTLYGGLGRYRLHLPYFELDAEPTLAFLRPDYKSKAGEAELRPVWNGYAWLPGIWTECSWKGIDVRVPWIGRRRSSRVIMEIDWTGEAASRLSVNRNGLKLNDAAKRAFDQVLTDEKKLESDFAEFQSGSVFSTLNCSLLGKYLGTETIRWVHYDGTNSVCHWREVECPFLMEHSSYEEEAIWQEDEAAILRPIRLAGEIIKGADLSFEAFPPTHIAVEKRSSLSIRGFWRREPSKVNPQRSFGVVSCFPDKWDQLCAVEVGYAGDRDIIWNQSHQLIVETTEEAWQKVVECSRRQHEFSLPTDDELCSSTSESSAWLLFAIKEITEQFSRSPSPVEVWDGFVERETTFIREIWSKAFGKLDTAVCFLDSTSSSGSVLYAYKVNGCEVLKSVEGICEFLPDLGPEWKIHIRRRYF
jgi:hypothetical protein